LKVEIIPATADQEPVLANLLELYAHDFSEFLDLELGLDGRFAYKDLPLYWREPDRHPFLVSMDGKLAGLVLVKRAPARAVDPAIWDMAEFFILRRYRRHGIGTVIAHQVWRRFPGPWKVRVLESNHAAAQFWERAISAFAGQSILSVPVETGGKTWRVFSFEATPVQERT
jgi:predicted acetyltransferase